MGKLKAVIIEDSKDVASFLDFSVRTLGYDTAVAHDGAVALDLLKQSIPDLILLDMHLPNVDGDTILRWVRSEEQFRQVPVVVLTGISQTLNKEIENLASFALVKPIDYRTLSQLITRLGRP
jgi:CheY-like chemotaxis protein